VRAGERWTLLAILAVGTGLRFWHLGVHGFTADEIYSLNVARMPLAQAASQADQTPPLFVLVEHFWILAAGTSEAAVRTLPAILGILAIPAAWWIARRFAGIGPALAAAALVAVHPQFVEQSQDARTYSLLTLLSTLSFCAMVRLPSGGRRTTLGYVAASTLLVYTHVFGWFVLIAQNAAWWWMGRPTSARRWLGLQATVVAAATPWLVVLAARIGYVGQGFWIGPPSLHLARETASRLGGGPVALAAACVVLAAIAWSFRGNWAGLVRWTRPVRLLACWLSVPFFLPLGISFLEPIFTPRYVAFVIVPAVILLAWGLWRLRPAGRAVALVALLAAGALAAPSVGILPTWTFHQEWPPAVAHVDALAHPGDAVVMYPGLCGYVGQELSCPWSVYGNRSDLVFVAAGDPARRWTAQDTPQLEAPLAGHDRVWLVQATDSVPGPLIQDWLASLYANETRSEFPGITVVFYTR
jgi:mannosyltransferase